MYVCSFSKPPLCCVTTFISWLQHTEGCLSTFSPVSLPTHKAHWLISEYVVLNITLSETAEGFVSHQITFNSTTLTEHFSTFTHSPSLWNLSVQWCSVHKPVCCGFQCKLCLPTWPANLSSKLSQFEQFFQWNYPVKRSIREPQS